MRRTRIAILFIVFALAGGIARAGEVTVPGDFPTIQAALDSPLVDRGDEIVLTNRLYVGPGNTNLDFRGKAVILRSAAGDPATCRIDAGGTTRHAIFDEGETAETRLEGVEFAGGQGPLGGSLLCVEGSMPTITNCWFTGNEATEGGAIACASASPSFLSCVFSQNIAIRSGGAVWGLAAAPVFEGCRFEANRAEGLVVTTGGAIYHANGSARLVRCQLIDNVAGTAGGAIYDVDGGLDLTQSDVVGNSAETGGGVFATMSSGRYASCRFTGNRSATEGGAIFVTGGSSLTLVNVTVAANTAPFGGGLLVTNVASVTIAGGIFWGNPGGAIDGGGVVDASYSTVEFGWFGEGISIADPMFIDADGPDDVPGTEDDDLRLRAGSPAIDAGRNDALDETEVADLDGGPRRLDAPASADTGLGRRPVVDQGAYEYVPPACAADLDENGEVDFGDLLEVLSAWGPCPPTCGADLDGDGAIDFGDLLVVLSAWGVCG